MIERSAILSREGKLSFNLPVPADFELAAGPKSTADLPGDGGAFLTAAEMLELEEENIRRALKAANGRVSGRNGAAELLQMKTTTLYSRLKKMEGLKD